MEKEILIQEIIEAEHLAKGKKNRHFRPDEMGTGKVLWIMYHANGDVHPAELCQKLGVTTPRITIILNALEQDGMVFREIDKKDRRKIVIHLTEKGKNCIEEKKKKNRVRVEEMINNVGEEDAKAYLRVLRYLNS